MIAVAICPPADKDGSDHQGARHTDGAHDIRQNAIMAPISKTLIFGFGKTVIDHPGPELLCAVVLICCQKLLGANESQRVEVVGRHDVRATLTAVQRQESHASALATRSISQHSAVFVVRMSCNH